MLELIDKIPFPADAWPGEWMWAETAESSFEVVQFAIRFSTRDMDLPLRLHISADNRYKLYLNGEFIGLGPQKGDISKWHFDTYELSSLDSEKEHVLSAVAWCNRYSAPTSQISVRPGFLVVAEGQNGEMFNTARRWHCRSLQNYRPLPVPEEALNAGCGFDMPGLTAGELAPSAELISTEFSLPVPLLVGRARDYRSRIYGYCPWRLAPRTIPALEAEHLSLGQCRVFNASELPSVPVSPSVARCSTASPEAAMKQSGMIICEANNEVVQAVPCERKTLSSRWSVKRCYINGLLQSSEKGRAGVDPPVVIPPNSTCKILVDHGGLTKGYPIIVASGGAGAQIRLTYQESLQKNGGDIKNKCHRDHITDCEMIGVMDVFRPDGRENVVFEPLWYRCWRYISVEITTVNEPLQLDSLLYRSTGYPLDFKADIQAGDWFGKLVDPALRTLRMCAEETYVDSPYYEQLQYVGDTRIQALSSYVLTGDDRLARQAIDAFDRSRLPSGMVQARYPARIPQLIPSFSLLYISMLHDFMMWRGDLGFVKEHLLGVKSILLAFEGFCREDGLLSDLPGWCFVDWSFRRKWKDVVPPEPPDGTSFLMNFHYLYALEHAADIFSCCGDNSHSGDLRFRARNLRGRLQELSFDKSRRLFTDDCGGQNLSQHTNIMAILTNSHVGLVEGEELIGRIVQDRELVEASCYYTFYLFEAMYHVGRADLIWPQLSRWHEMLDIGLTTFPENSGVTRSDCHGWSAHPLYHYFTSILGVRPVVPGCSEISVKPVARLKTDPDFPAHLSGSLMVPQGKLEVVLQAGETAWDISTQLPVGCEMAGCASPPQNPDRIHASGMAGLLLNK